MRTLFLTLMLALLLGISTVFAQDAGLALASTLDARAAANGLPSGDGAISAGEQALGAALSSEIDAFAQQVSEFAQSSPENSGWVASIEQTAQKFNGQIESIPAQGDPRAQAISDAVAQYGQEVEALQAQTPLDPRAQAISDAVAQYGSEPVLDPRGQAISDAVAQYGNEPVLDPRAQAISDAVAQYGRQSVDPRAQAISDAVAQYGKEIAQEQGQGQLSLDDQRRVVQTVRESASEYIDQSGVEHPAIAKRHINHLIQIMVPQHLLPINGYWRALPFSMTTSGQCVNTYGDNDGPGGNSVEEDPGQPLCGYASEGMLPFIVWNGETQPYLPGSSSIYSQEPRFDIEIVRDGNGQSTGSVKMTTTVEYEVVAPDQIHVHLLIQEEDGCSMSADYILELVTADESVCAVAPAISTPEPTEPPPVVEEGPYQVGLPLFNDETECHENNTPPAFSEMRLLEQPDGSIVMDYGTGQQVVYHSGSSYYEYDSGMAGATRQSISLYLYSDGSGGSLSWSINAKDGNICYASHDLTLPGAENSMEATPAPDGSDDSGESGAVSDLGDAPSVPLPEGTYNVTWAEFPGLPCPASMQPDVPNFPQVTITAADGGYLLAAGDLSYLLVEMPGGYSYILFGSDNSGVAMAISAGGMDGHLVGSYTAFSPAGETCMDQLDFAPVP